MHRSFRSAGVVVGLGLNGLGTLRALAAGGARAFAVTDGSGSPPEHTRLGEKIVCASMHSEPEALIDCLLRLRERLDAPAVLFPSGDLFLQTLSSARDVLSDGYLFAFPAKQTVDLILDKTRFYRFANENDVRIPPTIFPRDLGEVVSASESLRYPCLIKPAVATVAWRSKGWKLIFSANREELLRNYEAVAAVQPSLVVQEVIEGPDAALRFSLAYADSGGNVLGMFTGRKVRQHLPRFGISSLAESRWYADVDRMTRDLFGALHYAGYGSVEFKRDRRDGLDYVMEVTGRTWYPHALSEICGVNLPIIALASLSGEYAEPPVRQREGVKWVDEVNDVRSAFYYYRAGELSLREWMRSYAGELHLAHWRRGDRGPFWALVRSTAVRVLKDLLYPAYRLARRLWRRGRPGQ